MLEFFLVMFAVAVQSSGSEGTEVAAPAAPPPAATAPADPGGAVAEAPPSFLAPAGGSDGSEGRAEATAEAPPAFLVPGKKTPGKTAKGEARPAFLAPKTVAQAEAPPAFLAPAKPGLVAEPQQPTGRFTTAIEVKPILTATKASWIAVREFNGQDLVYVTQLWSWRCGLVELRMGINGAPPQVWPLPPCHADEAAPNAIKPEDGNPYATYPLGAVGQVEIQITYDDLSTDSARFNRNGVLIP